MDRFDKEKKCKIEVTDDVEIYLFAYIYIDEVIKFYWFKLGTRMGCLDHWMRISLTAQIL